MNIIYKISRILSEIKSWIAYIFDIDSIMLGLQYIIIILCVVLVIIEVLLVVFTVF